MGAWTDEVAKGEADVAELLGSLPGPMCPKIDGWVGRDSRGYRRRMTDLGRRRSWADDDMDALYEAADSIQSERDTALEGLEECRTALDALRMALLTMTDAYRQERDARIALEQSQAAS